MILVTVFVTGAGILALEIVGARLINPHFGVSLYVWSALITVTLIALAVGYAAGGWLADRRAAPGDLVWLLLLSAMAVAVVPLLTSTVFAATSGLGLRLGALIAASLLVAVPLTALAMITPYAVKLMTIAQERVGTSTGTVFAISTAGSVAGALATGFLLVPWLPLHWICLLLAVGLVLLAGLLGLTERAHRTAAVLLLLLIAGGGVLSVGGMGAVALEPTRGRELYHGQSLYGELRVVEVDQARLLLSNGIIQSGIVADGSSAFPYSYLIERIILDRVAAPRRVLLIGLGGGAVARSLQRHAGGAIVVDVVEIDPLVAELAQRYFDYRPGPGELAIEDGRRFLNTTERRYDAIVLDAYTSEALLHHLLSREAFETMRERLTPGGAVVLHYRVLAGDPDAVRASEALAGTLRAVFPSVTVYEVEAHGPLQSRIFVSTMEPAGRPADAITVALTAGPFAGQLMTARPRTAGAGNGLILTDLYNPIEQLDAATADVVRQANRRYLAPPTQAQ